MLLSLVLTPLISVNLIAQDTVNLVWDDYDPGYVPDESEEITLQVWASSKQYDYVTTTPVEEDSSGDIGTLVFTRDLLVDGEMTTHYYVGTNWVVISTLPSTATGTVIDVPEGQSRYFALTAENMAGRSDFSGVASWAQLTQPTGFRLTPGSN